MVPKITEDFVRDDMYNILTDMEEEVRDLDATVEFLVDYVMNLALGNYKPYMNRPNQEE